MPVPDRVDARSWPAATAGRRARQPPTAWSATPGHRLRRGAVPGRAARRRRALRDWFHFVAVVLPATARRAPLHRAAAVAGADIDAGRAPRSGARSRAALVELQKPAHTTFDVKFFWAAFRIGEARLGEDTLSACGSRDPQFRQPVVLGQRVRRREHLGGARPPSATESAGTRSTADAAKARTTP